MNAATPLPTVSSSYDTPTLRRHAVDTIRLSVPLAVAQVSQMAISVTDTVLLGALGHDALAAGGLATTLFFTMTILLQGVLTSVGVLIAQARGAQAHERIPALYWNGLWLAVLLMLPALLLMRSAEPLMIACGEPAALAHDAGRYAVLLSWGAPASVLGIGLMRAFLPAIGKERLLLWVSFASVFVNGFLSYGLIHGAWGLPRLGFLGAAAASVITLWLTAAVLVAAVHAGAAFRGFTRRAGFDAALLRELFALGWPVGATYAIETLLFLFVSLLIGRLGTVPLAAHQIALNFSAITFMVPTAIGQAANVRVAFWVGACRGHEARRAGFTAIGLGVGFMVLSCVGMGLGAPTIAGWYLNAADPANAATLALASSLLSVAAVFQVVDGTQAVASGTLRGLRDTRVPMLIAAVGYWGIGLGVGYALGFGAGLGAVGLWWGLAAGLATAAALLTLRFAATSRQPDPAGAAA